MTGNHIGNMISSLSPRASYMRVGLHGMTLRLG